MKYNRKIRIGNTQDNVLLEGNNFGGRITVADKYKDNVLTYEEDTLVMTAGNAVLFFK